jgi:3-oxoadipate enol-lactonase
MQNTAVETQHAASTTNSAEKTRSSSMHTTINGIEMAYEDVGSGEAIVLLHAFPLRGSMWQPQIEFLQNNYRVIVPDLRGFGASGVSEGPVLMQQFAADVLALCDKLGIEQFILGGLSMGGYIAFALLRSAPERVNALILADTKAAADTAEGQAGRETNARLVEEQGVLALADKVLPGLVAPHASEELRTSLRQIIAANQPEGIAGALRGMAMRPDSFETLRAAQIPTLIIVGSADGLTPPAEAHAMQDVVRGSRMIEIPGAGHLSNLEQPEAFNVALRSFLTVVRPAEGQRERSA